MIFIKIINFLIKIGPLWAHKNFKINVTGLVEHNFTDSYL